MFHELKVSHFGHIRGPELARTSEVANCKPIIQHTMAAASSTDQQKVAGPGEGKCGECQEVVALPA